MTSTNPEAGSESRASEPGTGPVFIVGCGRSGTTLLRLILNTHPALAIPQESHIVYELARRRATGRWSGDFQDEREWNRFLNDLEQHRFLANWHLPDGALRSRLGALIERNHRTVLRAIFESNVADEGQTRWGDKTPMHVQYLLLLHQLFPDASFVHVIRDGRDVAMSLMTRRWGPRHLSIAGHYWKWLTLSGAIGGAVLGPERYREVRFEDLLSQPELELRSLCDWLGLPYRPDLLAFHQTQAASEYAKGGPIARRLEQPLDPARTQLWRNKMSQSHQRSLVRQAGATLRHFGYEVDDLPRRQQREAEAIAEMLDPDSIRLIEQQALAREGGDRRLQLALLEDRVTGFLAFLRGRMKTFAKTSIRWQRTVAGMMR